MIDQTYQQINYIGKGGNARVLLGRDIKSKEKIAIKILMGQPCKELEIAFTREVFMHQSVQHENIIQIKSANYNGKYLQYKGASSIPIPYIGMEYAELGELFYVIVKTGVFSEPMARYYFHQLIDVLDYLHNKAGICHRDIKLQNIFMNLQFNLKVADFGWAIPLNGPNQNGKLQDQAGSKNCMAPEVLAGKIYSGRQHDLFAAAKVLFNMLTLQDPFELAEIQDDKYQFIAGNKPTRYWDSFNKKCALPPLSDDVKDLLVDMMHLDPNARPTLEEIKAHPWMQGPISTYEEIRQEFTKRLADVPG